VCVGGNTGKELNHGKDLCGVCGGDNSTCRDCANAIAGTKTTDICGACKEPGDGTRDSCVKLGIPKKLCLAVASTTVKIPAAGLSAYDGATCTIAGSATGVSAALSADKKAVEITTGDQTSNLGGATSKDLAFSCTATKTGASNSGALSAAKDVFFYNEAGIGLTSVSPSEVATTSTAQNLTITGSGFVNSTYLKCIVKKKGGNVAVDAVYVGATTIQCNGVPGSMKSEAYEISVDTCGTNQFDDSKKLTFTYTKAMPTIKSAKFLTCSTLMVSFNGPVQTIAKPAVCDHVFNDTANQTSLGSSYKCGMKGPFAIKVSMRGSPTFTYGSTLLINYLALKADR
jgi:hypothetical protein